MKKGIISEQAISQENHDPDSVVELGPEVVKVTIKNQLLGSGNVIIGWGNPNGGNSLIPGESVTYYYDDIDLTDNALYIRFDGVAGGLALVSTINLNKNNC